MYELFLDLNKELKPQTESRSEQFSSLSFLLTLTFLLLSIISTVEMIIYLGGHCPGLQNVPFLFLSMAQKHCLSSLMIRRQQLKVMLFCKFSGGYGSIPHTK